MENKCYKRFRLGIISLEKPSWDSLPGLGGPAVPTASFSFPYYGIDPIGIVHLLIQAATTLK